MADSIEGGGNMAARTSRATWWVAAALLVAVVAVGGLLMVRRDSAAAGSPPPGLEGLGEPEAPPTDAFYPVPEQNAELAARLIKQSSEAFKAKVGDPCITPDDPRDRIGGTPMVMVIAGDIHGECFITAWMPRDESAGVPMGYYGEDGSFTEPTIAKAAQ